MTHIRVEIESAVGTITIDRPERFNSLDVETARDLRKAGLQLARDTAVRAVVLRGTNGVFCSGADLKYIRAGGDGQDLRYLLPVAGSQFPVAGSRLPVAGSQLPVAGSQLPVAGSQLPVAGDRQPATPTTDNRQPATGYGEVFKQILEYIHSTISEIRRAPKPFLASVDGIAAAGGFGLAMSCDLVIASERASFEWAYPKTGLTGAESSTFMLPRLVGLRRAFELLFLNPRLDAKRAMEIGLINAVCPPEAIDSTAKEWARRLAEGPTEALGIAKELLNQAAGMDRLDVHLDRELDNLARIADGANFGEGIDAFFGKRQPQFGAK